MCLASHCQTATLWSSGSLVYFRDGACTLREEGIRILHGFISGDSGSPLGTTRDSHGVNTCLINVCLHLNDSCDILHSRRDFWMDADFIWLDILTHRRVYLWQRPIWLLIERRKNTFRKHKAWEKPLRSIITLHPQSLGLSVYHTQWSHHLGAQGRESVSLRPAWTIRETLSPKQQASFYFQKKTSQK